MSRLQKKCIIVSTGLHLLLLGIIVIGPAFTSSTTPEVRMIDFMPDMVVEDNVWGGGNPKAGKAPAVVQPIQPPAQPPPQPPPPRTEPRKAEPEVSERTRIERPDPNDWTTERKKKQPEIVTKVQTRKVPITRPRTDSADTATEARKAADTRRELARAFANTANGIRESSASATAIEEGEYGPGGGGPAYAGYDSVVQKVYQDAWVKPSDTSSDAPVVYATVTIARDGTVVPGTARITTPSNDSQMDASVQRVLDRVSTIGRPFPEGMKEKERKYKIRFDLTKRSLT